MQEIGQRPSSEEAVVLTLERGQRAVAHVRSLVKSQLTSAGLMSLVDEAVTAAAELTTNALIHTDSEVSVSVTMGPELLRVAVRDGSPIPPVPGSFEESSLCGRGLLLVTQLATRWGIEPATSGGKTVWFEMEPGGEHPTEDLDAAHLLELWTFDSEISAADASRFGAGPAPDTRVVRLGQVRADLLHGAKSHLDDLVRECVLVQAATGSDTVRDELSELAGRLTDLSVRLVSFRNQIRRQALSAGASREVFLTLELRLPASLCPVLAEYRKVLDEVDELAERGVLLTGTDTHEHRSFRRWKLDSVIQQLQA